MRKLFLLLFVLPFLTGASWLFVPSTGGGVTTPATIMGADLLRWYESVDASTVHKTGSTVNTWDDKAGSGDHFSQTTGTPTTATIGGVTWISLPTAPLTTSSNVAVSSAMGLFLGVKVASGSGFIETGNSGAGTSGWGIYRFTDPQIYVNDSARGGNYGPANITSANPAYYTFTYTGGTYATGATLRVNGADQTITLNSGGTIGSSAGFPMNIGTGPGGASASFFCEVILTKVQPTPTQVTQLESYVKTTCGL